MRSHAVGVAFCIGLVAASLGCSDEAPSEPSTLSRSTSALSVATGAMTQKRVRCPATRLPDGRVLLAGGEDGVLLDTAETFDETTGTFSAVGSMSTKRSYHSATALADGRVLVVGGLWASELATGEIFDPSTNQWSAAASMSQGRLQHTATLLSDGRVLVAGGRPQSGASFASSEVYDPVQNLWTSAGSMTTARSEHAAVLLSDGRVLVMGGYGEAAAGTAEIFDPASNTWTATAALLTPRSGARAVSLLDGRVLLVGGDWDSTDTEVFDPASGTWSSVGGLTHRKLYFEMVTLQNGMVLALGGLWTSSVERFDPSTNQWQLMSPLTTSRDLHSAALLPSGRVLVAGGIGGPMNIHLSSAELYEADTLCVQETCFELGRQCGLIKEDNCGVPRSCGECPSGQTCSSWGQCEGCITLVCDPGRCGVVTDSCENTIDCGQCPEGQLCTFDHFCCAPLACGSEGRECGEVENGCYGTVDCGGCPEQHFCGDDHNCLCMPGFCGMHGEQCGQASDGCGGTIECGTCPEGQMCTPDNQCVCAPRTCEYFQATCGMFWDGCGSDLNCGTCQANEYCAFDHCVCIPLTCQDVQAMCGPVPDGCGGTLDCGLCPEPLTCNGQSLCECIPTTCEAQGKNCGTIPDGCGGELTCGDCPWGQGCVDNVCACLPPPCGSYGMECGTVPDTCGQAFDCGGCAAGQVCQGNACVCVPTTCEALGKTCGSVPDGCGGALDCGACGPGQACSEENVCVCPPTTCAAQNSDCGTIPDGCGGTLSCGACGDGETCVANVCVANGLTPAVFDSSLQVPSCPEVEKGCDSTLLLEGISSAERNAPNTLGDACLTESDARTGYDVERIRVYAVSTPTLTSGAAAYVQVRSMVDVNSYSEKLDIWHSSDASNPSWTLLTTIDVNADGFVEKGVYVTLPDGPMQAVRAVLRYSNSYSPTSPAACMQAGHDDHDDLVFAVGPRVTITSPAAGSTVSGTVQVAATLGNSSLVDHVQFLAGGKEIGTSYSAPHSVAWNTLLVADGKQILTAKAFDAGSNILSVTTLEHDVFVANQVAAVAQYDSTLRAPRCGAAASGCASGKLLVGRAKLGPEPNYPNSINGSCSDGTAGTFHADESLDQIEVFTSDGSILSSGKTVTIRVTAWAWSTSDYLDLYFAPNASLPVWSFIKTIRAPGSGSRVLSTTFTLPSASSKAVIRGVWRYGGSAGACPVGSYNDVDDLVFTIQ